MASYHHHAHHPEYAPPVLRAPSPASSVGTTYTPDQTSLSDTELSQPAFERKWLAKLELDKPRDEEEQANESPLLPKPGSKEEEQAMVEKIMKNLRTKIQQLEEDELFEQTLLRGSQVSLEARPSTNDIDALMQSMMGSSLSLGGVNTKIFGRAAEEPLTEGPWTNHNRSMVYEGNSGMEGILASVTSASTMGKRSRGDKSRKAK